MARIRSIKPGFFNNLELADCDPLARLLFIGLWTFADREGRMKDQARKIKIEVFPYDNLDVEPLLEQLAKANFILRYTVKGAAYIQIVNFTKHQRPHKKEAASEIPAPDGYVAEAVQDTPEDESQEDPKQEENERAEKKTVQAVKFPGKPEKGTNEQAGEWRMENGEWDVGTGQDPPVNVLIQAFSDVCKKQVDRLNESQVRKMSEAMEDLRALVKQPDEVLAPRVRRFGEWFNTRGFKDPTPSFRQIVDDWGKFEAAGQKPAKEKAPISTVPDTEREMARQRRIQRESKLQPQRVN